MRTSSMRSVEGLFALELLGSFRLRHWGNQGRGQHKKDQQQKDDVRQRRHAEFALTFLSLIPSFIQVLG